MPRGDGTGPSGLGSMTGRGAGFCAGFNTPGYANPIGGRGFFGRGMGFGRGRGFRNRFFYNGLRGQSYNNSTLTKEEEVNILKNQAKYMQSEMENINNRIKDLEKETS
jgi:hypothetical protein